jgi:Ca-activated chloride channel family protein
MRRNVVAVLVIAGIAGLSGPSCGSASSSAAMAPGSAVAQARRGFLGDLSTESYDVVREQGFHRLPEDAVSTFSIDVDTASYANVRRLLNESRLPPAGAVRLEEMTNYFPTADLPPAGPDPFAVHTEVATCPWDTTHRLARIAVKAREIPAASAPPANLVFLVDVSGSMAQPAKLPLVRDSLKLLVAQLRPEDHVAMVVYAGASGLALPGTPGAEKRTILDAIDALAAGGSTNGGEGIRLAYRTAREGFVEGGVNRVILCTDGDFNVGVTSRSELHDLIRDEARTGVFLSVLGFGTGNLKDDTMETLADRGNGNYAYVDTLAEGRKVLVEQAGGTLVTIAKDVKIQVEFNPAESAAWRLLGYENRLLQHEDFADDRKDAGEIGSGHTVTAFYEVVPRGVAVPGAEPAELRYQQTVPTPASGSGELMTVRVRFKEPDGSRSRETEVRVADRGASYAQASEDFRFQAAVASAAMLLRSSEFRGTSSWAGVIELASDAMSFDPGGYRHEFVSLAHKASALAPGTR